MSVRFRRFASLLCPKLRGSVRLGAAVLVAGGTGWPLVGAVTASTPGLRLELVSQTPFLEPGQTSFGLTLKVTDPTPPSELDVAVSVYHGLSSRSAFDETLRNHQLSNPLVSFSPSHLNQLPRTQAGDLEVTVPVDTRGSSLQSSPALDLVSSPGGVYPVTVTLESAATGASIQRLVTYLVYAVPSSASRPLGVALVLPVQAPVRLSKDGKPLISPAWSVGLSSLAHALAANPKVPLTLAPSPETIDALAQSGRPQDHLTLSTLASWAQSPDHQVVVSSYVPISLSGLSREGLANQISAQLSWGQQVLATDLRVAPSTGDWIFGPGPLDRDALTSLQALHVDDVVVNASDLTPVSAKLTLAQPFELDGPGQYRPLSLVADAGLTSHFIASDPSLRAHQTMGDLAQIYFEQPNSPSARAVVLVPPDGWLPQAEFLEPLLHDLEGNPTVRPATLSQVFNSVPAQTLDGSVRQREPTGGQQSAASLPTTALERARRQTKALLSAAGGSPLQLSRLNGLVLAAESSALSTRQRQRYLRSIEAGIAGQLAQLSLAGGRTVTLTATAGRIPITIESRAQYPVRAVITVKSDKLIFQQSTARSVTLYRRDTTEYFDVQTRSPGDFPLQVSLASPQGHLVLLRARVTVRSTAASVLAVGLTVGAGAFLVLWWGRTLLRGRRARVPRPAATHR